MSKWEKIRILSDIFPLNQVPFDFTSWKKLPGRQLVDSVYVFLALLWNEAMIISKLEKAFQENMKHPKGGNTERQIRKSKIGNTKWLCALMTRLLKRQNVEGC